MVEIAHSIERELSKKLADPSYRKKFFLAEASARIAAQLIALRKKRGLNQGDVAKLIGTKQPAISRVERADYNNWSFNTLRAIADVLDARIRVIIEPSEDILREYDGADVSEPITKTLSTEASSSAPLRAPGGQVTSGASSKYEPLQSL